MSQAAEYKAVTDIWDVAYAALFASGAPIVDEFEQRIADAEAELFSTFASIPIEHMPRC